jgi:hypothetical protein
MPAGRVRASPPLQRHPRVFDAAVSTLRLAWFIEIVCVGIGLMVAVIAGFEAGGLWTGLIAAAPFAGAGVVELGRIPLVRSFFVANGLFY